MHTEFVPQEGQNPRFFTQRECARLQGFPETFVIDACRNDNRFYYQIGNSVCVPVIKAIGKCIIQKIKKTD